MKLMILEPAPNFGGGSEAVSLDLGRELAKRGHKIVLLHEIEGSMLPAYREFVVEVCQLNLPGFSLRAPLRTLDCAVRIGHLARRIGIDGIFSSHLGYVRIGALIRCIFGVPFCFHLGLPALGSTTFQSRSISFDRGRDHPIASHSRNVVLSRLAARDTLHGSQLG